MKKILCLYSYILLFPLFAFAEINLDSYELTEAQIKLIRILEKKSDMSESEIEEFAQKLDRDNKKPKFSVEIPEHSWEELWEVSKWAEHAAFASFTRHTNYEFDNDTYNADCPNRTLFNFGYATGTEHLRIDIIQQAINASTALTFKLREDPENFEAFFLQFAKETGADKYLKRKTDKTIADKPY